MRQRTIETDGFFEGVYDKYPDYTEETLTGKALEVYIPRYGRGDLGIARPVLFGFSGALAKHVPRLSLPYTETNNLMQIGRQFNVDGSYLGVPDGYTIEFSRVGRGRVRPSSEASRQYDQTQSLTVDILRRTVLEQVIESDSSRDDDLKRWQRVAEVAQPFGNAVLSFRTSTHSYNPMFGLQSRHDSSEIKPVSDDDLAQAVFDTVLYWQ